MVTGGGTDSSGWCGSPTQEWDHVDYSGEMSFWTGAVNFTFWPQRKLDLKEGGRQIEQ